MNSAKSGAHTPNAGAGERRPSPPVDRMPHTRYRFANRIAIFQGPYQKTIMLNYSVNLSTGGVFIETKNLLAVDTQLTIKFKFPDSDTVISCQARVAWTNEPGAPKKPGLPAGLGLSFTDLSLNDLHALRNHLHKGALIPTW